MFNRRLVLLAPFCLCAAAPAMAEATSALKLVAAARRQIGVTTSYNPTYQKLAFPGGDVPRGTGVCSDVVIRAYRDALGIDLQKLVHDDMVQNFAAYPKTWGLKSTDRNIDHRRVQNLATFFTRKGVALMLSGYPIEVAPGDVVTMTLPGNLPHIGIVSDARSSDDERFLLIHNIGRGAQEEDLLFAFKRTGHFRFGLKATH
jgi:uncharacterized protein